MAVGATWTWVPRNIFAKYPGLDEIAQGAGNYLQNASKQEHDGQMLFKIARHIMAGKSFADIKADVAKNRSKCIDAVAGMFNFLRKYGSVDGETMGLATQTSAFIRSEGNSSRRVGPDLWDVLGLDFRGQNQLPMLRHGALILMYVNKTPKCLAPADVKNVAIRDNLDKAIVYETVICEIADVIKRVGVAHISDVTAEFCRFQAACFALLMRKLRVDFITRITDEFNIEGENLTLHNLQWHFCHQIVKIMISLKMADQEKAFMAKQTTFSAFEMAVKASIGTEAKVAAPSVRDNSADNTGNVLMDAGWKTGQLVSHKKDKDTMWKIVAFENGKVKLISADGTINLQAPMLQFQTREWTESKEILIVNVAQDVPRPSDTNTYQSNLIKSVGYVSMHEALASQKGVEHIKINLKPKKSVEVTDKIAKGELQLPLQTYRLEISEKSKNNVTSGYSNSSMLMGSFSLNDKQYNMVASGISSSVPSDKSVGMQAPFWAIASVEKESEANCVLSNGLQIKPAKISDWIGSKCDTSEIMKVPMIVSSKVLKAGDTLKIFVPNKKQKTQ